MKDAGGVTHQLMAQMKILFLKLIQRNRQEIRKKMYHIIHGVFKYCIKYWTQKKNLQRQMTEYVKYH